MLHTDFLDFLRLSSVFRCFSIISPTVREAAAAEVGAGCRLLAAAGWGLDLAAETLPTAFDGGPFCVFTALVRSSKMDSTVQDMDSIHSKEST